MEKVAATAEDKADFIAKMMEATVLELPFAFPNVEHVTKVHGERVEKLVEL